MREEVREVLREVAAQGGKGGERLTVLVVTHDMELAIELSNMLWVMHQGAVAERGAPLRVLEQPESEVARDLCGESDRERLRRKD